MNTVITRTAERLKAADVIIKETTDTLQPFSMERKPEIIAKNKGKTFLIYILDNDSDLILYQTMIDIWQDQYNKAHNTHATGIIAQVTPSVDPKHPIIRLYTDKERKNIHDLS